MVPIQKLFSQCPGFCPSLTLDKLTKKVTIDDFTDLLNNVTVNAATYVNIDASLDCTWDLYAEVSSFISTPYTLSGTQGSFNLSNIDIRAVNTCETADQDYDGNGFPDCTTDLTRICNSFNGNFPLALGVQNYILGTTANEIADLPKTPAPCLLTFINDQGSATANPTTHRFRIDFELDFSTFPGVVATPGFYEIVIDFVAMDDNLNIPICMDQFTLEIEIQPILQLKMNTSSQLDFDFSDIQKYNSGIAKYGATVLEVSSNMNWDLFAIGTSTLNESAPGNPYWDNNAEYSSAGSLLIPLDALEIHQSPVNPFGGADYSLFFQNPPLALGPNNIEVARGTILPTPEPPSTGAKTIAGNWDQLLGGGAFMGPGSYVVPGGANWNNADFKYVISYRLTPGLPAEFPNGTPAMPTFARPGVYSMEVRFLLSEDQ